MTFYRLRNRTIGLVGFVFLPWFWLGFFIVGAMDGIYIGPLELMRDWIAYWKAGEPWGAFDGGMTWRS